MTQDTNTDNIVMFGNGQQIDVKANHKLSSVVIHPLTQSDIDFATFCGFVEYVDGYMIKPFTSYKNLYRVMLDVDSYIEKQIDVYVIIADMI